MNARTIRRPRTGWRGYGRWLTALAVGLAALQFIAAGPVSGAPGDVTEYPLPNSRLPDRIAAGPDGSLWFTEYSGNGGTIVPEGIGRITPDGAINEFSTGITHGSGPVGITAGADGNLWFTENSADRIGRITPEGVVTEFSTGITHNSDPFDITPGPDGNLWFSEPSSNRIGRITLDGVVTEFSAGITAGSQPIGITAGPDGNLWFAESTGPRIGRITPDGAVTEFSAGITADSQPIGITAGPDGNLWFTEISANRIGRITPDGMVTEFSAGITADSGPVGIAAGADGNLWFTENSANRIGRIEVAPPAAAVVSIAPASHDFAAQRVGTTSVPVEFTVSNTGNAPMAVNQVSLGGTNPGQFTIASDHCSATTVPAGTTCTLDVTFHPTERGSPTATVSVASNATSGTNAATLTGTGIGPAVSLTPASHHYGDQAVGTSSAPLEFTVTNTGNAPLTVNRVGIGGANPGDFMANSTGCTTQPVAPDNHCTIRVRFTPTASGIRSATLDITDDAPGSPHSAALTGTGRWCLLWLPPLSICSPR